MTNPTDGVLRVILKTLMERMDWTQGQVAARAAVDQSVISRILTNPSYQPKDSTLDRLATAFGITKAQLTGQASLDLMVETATDKVVAIRVQTGGVPMITPAQLVEAGGRLDKNNLTIKALWVLCPVYHGDGTYAIQLDTEAMKPEYREGELLCVDPSIPPANGQDIVLIDDGRVMLRRFVSNNEGVFVRPLNQRWLDGPRPITENMIFCGTVIFSGVQHYIYPGQPPLGSTLLHSEEENDKDHS